MGSVNQAVRAAITRALTDADDLLSMQDIYKAEDHLGDMAELGAELKRMVGEGLVIRCHGRLYLLASRAADFKGGDIDPDKPAVAPAVGEAQIRTQKFVDHTCDEIQQGFDDAKCGAIRRSSTFWRGYLGALQDLCDEVTTISAASRTRIDELVDQLKQHEEGVVA